jgi:hypothetical protein
MPNAMTPQELERFIDRTLRSLPPRPAPASLAHGVLASIQARGAAPSRRDQWQAWPAPLRAACVLVGLAVAGAIVASSVAVYTGADLGAALSQAAVWIGYGSRAWHALAWMADLLADELRALSPHWLTIGKAFIAALYASFFGLIAVFYSLLSRTHGTPIRHDH